MNPDKKYMPNKENKDDDLNLAPFDASINNNKPLVGWIPIFIMNKDKKDNNNDSLPANAMVIPSSISNLNLDSFSNVFDNKTKLMPFDDMNVNLQPWNNKGSFITPPDNYSGNYDKNVKNATSSPNLFPNEYSSDDLFIYNTDGSTSSNNRLDEKVTEILRNIDLNLDEDTDLIRHCNDKRIDKIYELIEKEHPEICALMDNYNIPSPISKLILRRTIKVTLEHCKR